LIVVRDTGEMAGYANFHAPPEDRGWVEIGYQIRPEFRRRGYAFEAVIAMFLWAAERGVDRFRASVSPGNEPSLAMVRKMGFSRVGQQWDDVDGLEFVFEASLADVQEACVAALGPAAAARGETSSDR
jgi:ribosomal-protein-alanine N-acetyltransferase